MGFEVAPTRPGRGHGIRAAVVVGMILVLTIAIAVLSRSSASPASLPGRDPLTGAAAPEGSPQAGSTPGVFVGGTTSVGPSVARVFPRVVSCYRTVGAACRRIVRAALDDLPADAPRVRSARVWGSLICDDDRDCSASRLVGYRPLGSTVLTFGPAGPEVWINVMESTPDRTRVWAPTHIQAWIVRWFADPVSS